MAIEKLQKESFKYLGNYDTSFFLDQLVNLDWNAYVDRQNERFGMQSTFTIPIVWDLKLQSISIWPPFKIFRDEILKLEKTLTDLLGEGTIYTCVLTKLPAGKSIDLHYDNGEFFNNTNRIHIPITTNDQTFFHVGEESVNMKVNEMWEISNHNKIHGVFNSGTTDRIHLMIDWGSYMGSLPDIFS